VEDNLFVNLKKPEDLCYKLKLLTTNIMHVINQLFQKLKTLGENTWMVSY